MKKLMLILSTAALFTACGDKEQAKEEPRGKDNVAYRWGTVSLVATANDTDRFRPRPTVTSRILALIWTSVYDAWSRYDAKAEPMFLRGVERRPEEERTLENKEKAISYACYRAMMHYYWTDSTMFIDSMRAFGFDPHDNSLDPATPQGIGNLAAMTVIEERMNDGSNELGDMPGTIGSKYSDYTGYEPINHPDTLRDINRWQPKYFSDGKGGWFAPACLTPQWWKVKPLALDSPSQHRPGPPPAIGSEQLAGEVREVVEMQANLTNEQKALVEFMRDGPRSVQQAGHWLIFARDVSVRDSHTLDQDVKMYFLNQMAAMDAFIASWDSKMHYDYVRPYQLVHHYYEDQIIKAWKGPDSGWVSMQGQEWRPYSPETFLCPPFPAYTSGHSTVSGACSEVLRLFTGSDHFGEQVKLVPGILTENEEDWGDTIILDLPTFTETANLAGISRVLGGYHIQADNLAGLELGRDVAQTVWKKYLALTGDEEIASTH
jgi:hypothetical protein